LFLVDRATRKELKSDKFALEVQHGVEYVTDHKKLVTQWGGIAAAVVLIVLAVVFYMRYQRGVRLEALQDAMRVQNSQVGPPNNEYTLFYPSQADKDKAVQKTWSDLAAKYSGSEVGVMAEYYLAGDAADKGNTPEAEKRFKAVVESGDTDYASLAKISLAQIYASEGKLPDARNMIQSIIDHPTAMVSKEAATIALAHVLAPSDPAAARKLLEPLRGSDRPAVSRAALTALSELQK